MTVSIDASTLLGFYQARSGASASGSSTSSSSTKQTVAPTPPWNAKSDAASQSSLVQTVMAGSRFIDPTAAKLSADAGTNAGDYKNLFSLYQGLSALEGVATASTGTNLSAAELSKYQSRFKAGMAEVQKFLGSAPFDAFTVAQGQVSATAQTTVGVKRENDTFTTSPIFTGTLTDPVPAFQGSVAFGMTLTKPSGATVNVAFDLSQMGSTPRTMSNVVIYMNSKLQAAGVQTRVANLRIPATPTTVKTGDTTTTIPAGKDSFALKIVGVSTEIPAFTASTSTPAVYVAGSTGRTAAQATTTLKADATLGITKFDGGANVATETDGTTKIFGRTLPSDVTAVRSTVTGSDGSLYVLADVNGTTTDGQTIKGASDVALIKYDSAGDIAFTRTLGASSAASGYAMAMSSDGKSIAVAGTVSGVLDGAGGTASTSATDSFTSVFTSAGEESWTTRRTGSTGLQPTAVSFAPDGSVYVVGKTGGSVQGGTAIGGGDGWMQAFSVKGSPTYTAEIGTTKPDRAAGVSADANGVVVASVENGHAVLRRYDIGTDGKLQAGVVRDLGDLKGGDIAGVGRAADGSVLVAGVTHNNALTAGTITDGYDGGREPFVAKVSSGLTAASSDRLTYVNMGADATASAMTVSGGKVYIAGQLDQGSGKTLGYAVAVDPTTGAKGWYDTIKGADDLAAPTAVAVAQGGASVLDKLHLPTGQISYAGSQTLVANTSLRAGDQFSLKAGAASALSITIDAGETLKTLAAKLNRAMGFKGKAEVVSVSGYDQIKITPDSDRTAIQVIAGTAGRDGLSALGLSEGLIKAAPDTSSSSSSSSSSDTKDEAKAYGLKLPSTVGIGTTAAAKQTAVLLSSAMTTLQLAYSDLAFPASKTTAKSSASSEPISPYLTNKISNYQLALSRLSG